MAKKKENPFLGRWRITWMEQWDMFGLSKHELDVIFYCGMELLKILVLTFFFFPWLEIRLLVRGKYP